MPKKSIYRGPNAQHFQLVHRSQRDPLIHDPEASQQVLKPFQRDNDVKKGRTRTELESLLSPEELARERANVGQAAEHGIYYDDTEYDYMQHLRDPNVTEEGMETIMIEAPQPTKHKGKAKEDIELRLPADVLASSAEMDRKQVLDSQQAIPTEIAGFQPDMNPHLRQALEALEEDAFVDDELEDDFFGELIHGGELSTAEELDFEFKEEGVEEEEEEEEGDEQDESFEARFARFKKQQKQSPLDGEGSEFDGTDMEGRSETADTVSRLPVIGGKRRRKGAGTASSGFSMTSSAVYRNAGLTLLDERFEQFDKTYDDDLMPPDTDSVHSDEDSDDAPDLIAAREDFEAVMDDFLANYELVGRKMEPVLAGATSVDKLNTIRRALGEMRINPEEEENDDDILMPKDIDQVKERWDCETILSTYSNLENHPRLIRARQTKPVPKIQLDPRTGMPSMDPPKNQPESEDSEDDEDGDSDDTIGKPRRATIARPKNETKEERKARKLAVKQERQTRRQDKKALREQFSSERKQQVKVLANRQPTVKKL
ncbi:hypothetical protein M422DRAFT_235698 [Sphaerobolus stellatus SS14]|uniref:Protein LTV1 n=1 Tax=Sphaerobolus stellatus (strain SS14) TaxID=990650 RepID=A0A0C9TFK3_SPHS4|nr:hypothetical protein M422DRAFT_235698 [Sphaerobolus stellatus SS14]